MGIGAEQIFQVGIVVADLGRATRELSEALGCGFTVPWEAPWIGRTPVGDCPVGLRCCFGTEHPHLELIEAKEGTLWASQCGSRSRIHHIGAWVDDLAGEAARMESLGMPSEVAGISPRGQCPSLFSYHLTRFGVRIELIDRRMQPGFEAQIATARRESASRPALDVYQIGIVVPELEPAMRGLGAALGLEWSEPIEGSDTRGRTPVGDISLGVRAAVSRRRPHLELIEGQRGTLWDTEMGSRARIHHIGAWAGDLAREAARLERLAMPIEIAGIGPDGGSPWMFTYHQSALGLRIELVDRGCADVVRLFEGES